MKITATKFDADALANSAKSYIEMLLNKKVTMPYVLNDWNICVEQSHFTGVFDFPTTGYSRKAQIIADLENAITQLNAYVEPSAETTEMQAIQLEHCFSCMARSKDTSNIIWNEEEAHAEALEMNVSTNEALTTNATNEGSMTTTNTYFANLLAVRSATFGELETGVVFIPSSLALFVKAGEGFANLLPIGSGEAEFSSDEVVHPLNGVMSRELVHPESSASTPVYIPTTFEQLNMWDTFATAAQPDVRLVLNEDYECIVVATGEIVGRFADATPVILLEQLNTTEVQE